MKNLSYDERSLQLTLGLEASVISLISSTLIGFQMNSTIT